jgi:gliding motility-associated lipoprotein GldH
MKSIHNFLGVITLAALLCACNDKVFYESTQDLQGSQWAYGDTLDFRFSIVDTTQLYDLYLHFAYVDSFPTQNVYLRLHTRFPDGKRPSKVKSFDLFDALGNPVGDCSGHRCKARLLLQDNAFFNQTGEYCLTLEQFTRTAQLGGISGAGLVLEKAGPKPSK